jgi:hypothetical protein
MTIAIDSKADKRPGDLVFGRFTWGIEDEFLESYLEHVEGGFKAAQWGSVAVVMLCRTAMPHLSRTLDLIDQFTAPFLRRSLYVLENDSTDNTADVLDAYAASRQWVAVEHDSLGGADDRGFSAERTNRLARCRSRCQAWVRENARWATYVVVLDSDGHGGFDPDGVFNSIGWLGAMATAPVGGMASYSLFLRDEGGGSTGVAQYDAWAARLNDWRDTRQHQWFHLWLPPVASPPVQMFSAFGGLAVYNREAFLAGTYAGGDCEHVAFHRSMRAAGFPMYLNPGSRYVAILP